MRELMKGVFSVEFKMKLNEELEEYNHDASHLVKHTATSYSDGHIPARLTTYSACVFRGGNSYNSHLVFSDISFDSFYGLGDYTFKRYQSFYMNNVVLRYISGVYIAVIKYNSIIKS